MTGARKVAIKEPVPLEDETQKEALDNEGAPVKDEPEAAPEPEAKTEDVKSDAPAEVEILTDWHVGDACRNCGKRGYKYTTGNGAWCDLCDVEDDE